MIGEYNFILVSLQTIVVRSVSEFSYHAALKQNFINKVKYLPGIIALFYKVLHD